jgi:glycosyltransferase involved in cell wall biosynthesis
MKILFLNYEYPPLGGGAGNATAYLLREFSRLSDLQVDLITSAIDNVYSQEKVGENIVIHRLPIGKNAKNLHFQSQKDLLVYSWKAYGFARKLMQRNRYDVVHAFFAVPCGVLAWLLGREFRVPYIVSLRGADVPGYSERFRLLYGFLKPLVRQVWKRSAATVANSEGLKALALKTRPSQAIGVIYNGVDTEQFSPQGNSNESVALRMLAVSRLTPRKGLRYLLEAAALLKGRYGAEKIGVEIIGEGDEKETLVAEAKRLGIEDVVRFAGRVEHDDLPPYYRRANVFVLPSLNEGMSNTVLEAIASGLAVLATDTGGTRELVRDGENGFLIEMKSAQDIAEKAGKFVEQPGLAAEMGAKSRQLAESMSWKKVAEAYYDLYGQVSQLGRVE